MAYLKIKDGILKYALPPFDEKGMCEIPEGVLKIAPGAFSNNIELAQVQFPTSLIEIGKGAFSNCTALKKVSIPSTVKLVGESAFSGCISLESLECVPSVTFFMENCFTGCYLLRDFFNGYDRGRIFYHIKHKQFAVTVFSHNTKQNIAVYKGRYAGANFPSSPPIGPAMVYFAVATDLFGKEFMYYSLREDEAIEGAVIQARHDTVRGHFGLLKPETLVPLWKFPLICGFCPIDMDYWIEDNGMDRNLELSISDALLLFRKYLPGVFRRLAYILNHQNDFMDILSQENQLTDEEIESPVRLDTEKYSMII